MVITYKNLQSINFPCFEIPSGDITVRDGLVFLNGKILDDRNMKGETLGIRRLQTPHKNLLKLKYSFDSPIGIFKNKGTLRYVDDKGKVFIYTKTKFCNVVYHKIKKIDRKEKASILWVHGVSFPFIIPRPPSMEYLWAGILYLKNKPWMLYDYSAERLKSYRRKI